MLAQVPTTIVVQLQGSDTNTVDWEVLLPLLTTGALGLLGLALGFTQLRASRTEAERTRRAAFQLEEVKILADRESHVPRAYGCVGAGPS